ncbi:hypothetical protein Tco_0948127 [Tanacetum coccineum]
MESFNVVFDEEIPEALGDNGIFISESTCLRSCLKKFDLENAKSIKTPMSTDLKLTLEKDGISVDSSKDNPKESHMDAVLLDF